MSASEVEDNELIEIAESVPKAPAPSRAQTIRWAALSPEEDIAVPKGAIDDLVDHLQKSVILPLEVVILALAAASDRREDVGERLKKITRQMAELEQQIVAFRTKVISHNVGEPNE